MHLPKGRGYSLRCVLGILACFDLKEMGHYTESAEALYLMAHALRRAHWEVGLLYDPHNFDVPLEAWLSKEYINRMAEIIWQSRPKVDLTNHILLTSGKPALLAAGMSPVMPEIPTNPAAAAS